MAAPAKPFRKRDRAQIRPEIPQREVARSESAPSSFKDMEQENGNGEAVAQRRAPGQLLTAQEVAELLAVSPAWVYEQSRRGRIPTVHLGRYRRYRREAIDGWLREAESAGSGCSSGAA